MRLACKKMSLTVAGERARIEALLKREFRALQQAQHPHIVRLHGVVIDDPTSVSLLMGLSPIGSLRKLLDQVSFRVRVRLSEPESESEPEP